MQQLQKTQTILGVPILFAAVSASTHKPRATFSSVREYLWSLSMSKHSMIPALGVDAPNASLRLRYVNPSEFRPMPAWEKMSSKSVESSFIQEHVKAGWWMWPRQTTGSLTLCKQSAALKHCIEPLYLIIWCHISFFVEAIFCHHFEEAGNH